MKYIHSCFNHPMHSCCAEADELARCAAVRYIMYRGGMRPHHKVFVTGDENNGYTGVFTDGHKKVFCKYVDDTHYEVNEDE